jgi:hypothetical protein
MKYKNKKLLKQGIVDTVVVCLVCLLVGISVHAEDMNSRERFTSLFPAPPPGWTADALHVEEIDADENDPSALVGALFGEKKTHYRGERSYVQNSTNGRVTIGICTSDCTNAMLIPRGDDLKDPAVLKQYKESGMEPFTHLSYNGVLCYDDRNRIELICLDIDLCRIVLIGVDAFGDADAAMKFLQHVNFGKIEAFIKGY